jgi:hypothetical protein
MIASVTRPRIPALLLLALLLYALLAATYFVFRYQGRWSDSDTATLTQAAAAISEQGTLLPDQEIYALGFAYQSVLTFFTNVTGLGLVPSQFLVFPFLAAFLSVSGYVLYRELTGSMAAGALATLLLFLQPDFLFVVFRGSHEKLTWLVAMTALFMLAKSFTAAQQPRRLAMFVGLFYLASFALISSNVFFGSSFLLVVGFSLVAGLLLMQVSRNRGWQSPLRVPLRRLVYVVISLAIVWALVVLYLYEPASRIFLEFDRGLDRAAAVALGMQPGFDPYASVGTGWTSTTVYLGVVLPSWILAAIAFLLWLRNGFSLLTSREPLPFSSHFLVWLLYGGFGVQFAAAIILDRSGGIAGNLQQRLFPLLMFMSFPIVTSAITRYWSKTTVALRHKLPVVGLSLLVIWACGASLLKATNEPSLSNYWSFWTVPEDRAVDWIEKHLQYRDAWLGLDGIRVSAHAVSEGFGTKSGNFQDTWVLEERTRHILVSDFDKALRTRRSAPLPDVREADQVYDSGTVAQYHLRPQTPYQR